MWASPFEIALLNLRRELSPASLYYLTQEEAYARLKKISGMDFGYDDMAWEKWGTDHRQMLRLYDEEQMPLPENRGKEGERGQG